MAKKKPQAKPKPLEPVRIPEPCDRCGYSAADQRQEKELHVHSAPLYYSTTRIADSAFEIIIEADEFIPGGRVYLCNHHYRQHEAHIASKGYKVVPWGESYDMQLNV